jgi:hypothetical protein
MAHAGSLAERDEHATVTVNQSNLLVVGESVTAGTITREYRSLCIGG